MNKKTVLAAAVGAVLVAGWAGATYTTGQKLKTALVAQADHPVRWVECIQAMAARGVSHVYECGPGKVLAPQSKRIDPALTGLALVDLPAIEQGISQWRALQTSA